jgi:PHD/YefM family antitoxin component YafN of YafNO toxin-antitoxin module
MRTISAQEIKRRGIGAVDDLLAEGPVHIITRNEPRYVVMDECRYQELVEGYHEAYVARVLAAKAAAERGEVKRYASVAALLADMDALPDDDE